jgi:hypothetical protein
VLLRTTNMGRSLFSAGRRAEALAKRATEHD